LRRYWVPVVALALVAATLGACMSVQGLKDEYCNRWDGGAPMCWDGGGGGGSQDAGVVIWVSTFGSKSYRATANGVARASGEGDIVVGTFSGRPLDQNGASLGLVGDGGSDAFVVRYADNGDWQSGSGSSPLVFGGPGEETGVAVATDDNGSIFLSGAMDSGIEARPGITAGVRANSGGDSYFLQVSGPAHNFASAPDDSFVTRGVVATSAGSAVVGYFTHAAQRKNLLLKTFSVAGNVNGMNSMECDAGEAWASGVAGVPDASIVIVGGVDGGCQLGGLQASGIETAFIAQSTIQSPGLITALPVGDGHVVLTSVAVDAINNRFVVAGSAPTLWNVGGGGVGPASIVVASLTADFGKADAGVTVNWAVGFGTSAQTAAAAVAVDSHGAVYVAGRIGNNDSLNFGSGVVLNNGSNLPTAFLVKLTKGGVAFWCTTIPATSGSEAHALVLHDTTPVEVTVVGEFSGQLRVGAPIDAKGTADAFIIRFRPP
jgi:hypothetical protein